MGDCNRIFVRGTVLSYVVLSWHTSGGEVPVDIKSCSSYYCATYLVVIPTLFLYRVAPSGAFLPRGMARQRTHLGLPTYYAPGWEIGRFVTAAALDRGGGRLDIRARVVPRKLYHTDNVLQVVILSRAEFLLVSFVP